MSDTAEPQPELGVECSCGFKRRATKTADGGERWNGREIEGLHCFQIERDNVERKTRGDMLFAHCMSIGLIADATWPITTVMEQLLGEAYWAGYWEGRRVLRIQFKARLDTVTAEELGR